MNDNLRIGGERVNNEADEIAFRCQAGEKDGVQGVWWLRYIALVRRRSFKIWIQALPDRFVKNDGQGGGGALSVEELVAAFRLNTLTPVLIPRSVCHTDSAKAYNRLGVLVWPERLGDFQSTELFQEREPFVQFQFVHTTCLHKKGKGKRVAYAPERKITFWDGEEREVLAGTQYVDGFWPFVRRTIGRKAVNTGLSFSEQRFWLHANVRFAQWRYWFLDQNRFEIYGSYLKLARAA